MAGKSEGGPPAGPQDRELPVAAKLAEVFSETQEFLNTVFSEMKANCEDKELEELIDSSANSMSTRLARLGSFTHAKFDRLSQPKQAEVNELLDMLDCQGLAKSGRSAASKKFSLVKGWKNFLKWITQHFRELKKLILAIIDFIIGLFGGETPGWLNDLAVLLDEIFDFITSLFGGSKGENQTRLHKEFSDAEVNYLNELAALARLKMARLQAAGSNED